MNLKWTWFCMYLAGIFILSGETTFIITMSIALMIIGYVEFIGAAAREKQDKEG